MENVKEDVKKIIELNNFNSTTKAKLIHALYNDKENYEKNYEENYEKNYEETKRTKTYKNTKRGYKAYTQEELNSMVETLKNTRLKDKAARAKMIARKFGRTETAIKILFNAVLRQDKSINKNLKTEQLRQALSNEKPTTVIKKKRGNYKKVTQIEVDTVHKELNMGNKIEKIAKLLNTTPKKISYIKRRIKEGSLIPSSKLKTVSVGEGTKMPKKTSFFG